jgi:hypothetical protein
MLLLVIIGYIDLVVIGDYWCLYILLVAINLMAIVGYFIGRYWFGCYW